MDKKLYGAFTNMGELTMLGPNTALAYGLMKCPGCESYFFHRIDLEYHVRTHWKPAKYGGDWAKADLFPSIKKECQINGSVERNGYRYELQEWRIVGQVILRTSLNIH